MPMTSFGGLWTIFAALSVSGRTEHSKTGKNQHITCSRLFKAKVIRTKYGSLCPKSITPYFKKVWERDRLDLNIPALIRVNILFSQQGNGLYYTLSPLHTLQQKQSTKASFFSLPLERNIVGRVCVFVYAAGGPRERIKKALLHTHHKQTSEKIDSPSIHIFIGWRRHFKSRRMHRHIYKYIHARRRFYELQGRNRSMYACFMIFVSNISTGDISFLPAGKTSLQLYDERGEENCCALWKIYLIG